MAVVANCRKYRVMIWLMKLVETTNILYDLMSAPMTLLYQQTRFTTVTIALQYFRAIAILFVLNRLLHR